MFYSTFLFKAIGNGALDNYTYKFVARLILRPVAIHKKYREGENIFKIFIIK